MSDEIRSEPVGPERAPSEDPGAPILVTGAPGWLGTRLVEVLSHGSPDAPELGAEREIRCLVAPGSDSTVLHAIGPRVKGVGGDLRLPGSLAEFVHDARGATLFHVAGLIHPRRRTSEFREVNVDGTRHLLEHAERAGVRRVVHVSSNSVAGCATTGSPLFDESTPPRPYMGYGRSKAEAERLVREGDARGAFETVIVRAPWFYGPHQPERQTRFFQMIRAGRFPILGDGQQRRSMAYVDNLCQGLLLSAARPEAAGQTYWIADERPYTINEIVETVASVLEDEFDLACKKRRLRLPALLGRTAERVDAGLQAVGLYNQEIHVLGEMDKEIACSVEKARAELSYAPRWSLREGMGASIRWCLENGRPL